MITNNKLTMKKYILHFSPLNSNSDVELLEFTSAKKRESFIAERIIGAFPKRVFTLIAHYSETNENLSDVYIFDSWVCIQDVIKKRWKVFTLFEWQSYDDAYKNALDLKEISPLCYGNDNQNYTSISQNIDLTRIYNDN